VIKLKSKNIKELIKKTFETFKPIKMRAAVFLKKWNATCISVAFAFSSPLVVAQSESDRVSLTAMVQQVLVRHPQVFQSEAESRAAEARYAQAGAARLPRMSMTSNVGRENQHLFAQDRNTRYRQSQGQIRIAMPVYDPTINADEAQRRSQSISLDWRLVDVREQLMIRAVDTYGDLLRQSRLVGLARENLKRHRQYVQQIKEIARSDVGRAADLPAAQARVALAESVLTNRLTRLEAARVQWMQLSGTYVHSVWDPLPTVSLPNALDEIVANAIDSSPALQVAQADIETAKQGVAVSKSAFLPRLIAENYAKRGNDVGGVQGWQNDRYYGVSMDWALPNGMVDRHANRAAEEMVIAARHARDSLQQELRARVENQWFELLGSEASLKSYNDYVASAEQMVAAYREQFKIGRRSLLEVLNAENELFTARSNVESTRQDMALASWRLVALQGRMRAELGL
jgi:adhesin transport system outer membrane protein